MRAVNTIFTLGHFFNWEWFIVIFKSFFIVLQPVIGEADVVEGLSAVDAIYSSCFLLYLQRFIIVVQGILILFHVKIDKSYIIQDLSAVDTFLTFHSFFDFQGLQIVFESFLRFVHGLINWPNTVQLAGDYKLIRAFQFREIIDLQGFLFFLLFNPVLEAPHFTTLAGVF